MLSNIKVLLNQGIFAELRCSSLEGSLALWEEYLNEARKHVFNLKERAFEIKYGDLLCEPYPILKKVADFCDLDTSDEKIENLSQSLKKDRAHAYLNDPELKAFAEKVADRLRIQGY